MMRCLFAACGVLILTGLSSGAAEAQERATTTNYFYARPSDLTLVVNVVGFIQRPGRYEVASTIDLVNLISLAGGPTPDGTLSDVRITRIAGGDGPVQRREIRLDLEDVEGLRAEDLILSPGDMVTVGRTTWSAFRDAFGVVVSAAIVTTAISQIIIATR